MSGPSLLEPLQAPSWLARRDPRLRLLSALLLAIVVVSLSSWLALTAALVMALLLAGLLGLGADLLLRRVLAMAAFLLMLLLVLPLTVPGDAIASLGPLAFSEQGLRLAGIILLRASTIVILTLALLGTLDSVVLAQTLARLRLPPPLVLLFLLTARYLDLMQREYLRLRQAMRARAFAPRANRHSWRSLGWLIGMLLVRSFERSRRIQAAMLCRGFDGQLRLLDNSHWQAADTALLTLIAGLGGLLLGLEHLP